MKRMFIFLLALLGGLGCCFGQTDTNLIATGDWSEAVNDNDHWLRGRLLVYDDGDKVANRARVYLELQHLFHGGWDGPIGIYYNAAFGGDVHFELKDASGKPVPQDPVSIRGPSVPPVWIVLPCDSTVRLRADIYNLEQQPKPDGLVVFVDGGYWVLHPNPTNDIFLSASFSPSKEHASPLSYDMWQGTLKLPPVKISAGNHE